MYQPVNMDNGFAVAVPAPGDYVPISILSEMLDKRFNQQKIDFSNALADSEKRTQSALAEMEMRMRTALAETEVRMEIRMQSALAETEGRLCKAIGEVDKRLNGRIDKLEESGREMVTALTNLEISHTAKIEVLERAHAILVKQVQTGMFFNPIHDLGNVSLAGLPGNAQEYLEHQRQEIVVLHQAVQQNAQQLLSLPMIIRTEFEKVFGEHKQVMEFRMKKMDDRLAAFIGTGDKLG